MLVQLTSRGPAPLRLHTATTPEATATGVTTACDVRLNTGQRHMFARRHRADHQSMGCLQSLESQTPHTAPHLHPLQVARRQSLLVRAAAGSVSTNDFKNGMTVEIDGQPFRVMGESLCSYCLPFQLAVIMHMPGCLRLPSGAAAAPATTASTRSFGQTWYIWLQNSCT